VEDKHEYISSKHRSKEEDEQGMLKKKYIKNTKAQKCVFLASLSDLELDSGDCDSSSSEDVPERKTEGKFNSLCFLANIAKDVFASCHLMTSWWLVIVTPQVFATG
jgi:hypothetical protein